ncbi:hypothetical protein ACN6K5_003505 [Streptomyces violaceoruber]|uniref:hypothetical protein n=1 Tax=Streptomyces violaceoruber TaxID=1935 RepID=UPI00403CCDD3
MPLLTPAEELRSAALYIRRHADGVTPGPWKSEAGVALGHRVGTVDETNWVAWTGENGEEHSARDADWIALFHPMVGLGIADWLENTAVLHTPRHHNDVPVGCCCGAGDFPCNDLRHALAVARQINGGSQ